MTISVSVSLDEFDCLAGVRELARVVQGLPG
jgi:hypothetical protein